MSPTDSAVQEQRARAERQRVANDFSIQIATVNGSGSQTANLVLLRSLLLMGIPASGKNMFPSNIAGLPTWYTVRASAKGYIGRKKEVDLLVAMNAETAREDVMTLAPGAAVVYDEPLKLNELRTDLEDEWLAITFTDSGGGISPEQMSKIFEPYFTTKASGTGLGLLIVRRIVREHGGDIEVDSAPGQGARFTLAWYLAASTPCKNHRRTPIRLNNSNDAVASRPRRRVRLSMAMATVLPTREVRRCQPDPAGHSRMAFHFLRLAPTIHLPTGNSGVQSTAANPATTGTVTHKLRCTHPLWPVTASRNGTESSPSAAPMPAKIDASHHCGSGVMVCT